LAVCALAGPVAEWRRSKTSLVDVLLGGDRSDIERAIADLEKSRFSYRDAERLAKSVVAELWAPVEAIAAALIDQGCVDYRTARALFERSAPPASDWLPDRREPEIGGDVRLHPFLAEKARQFRL
jgi:hypothetical protein